MNKAVPISELRKQYAKPPSVTPPELTVLDYWRIIIRYKWSVVGLTLAGVLIGISYAFTTTPIYKATATLLVEPAQPKFVNIQALEGPAPLTLFYETQYEILGSRAIAETVVQNLSLASNEWFLRGRNPAQSYQWDLWPETWRDWLPEDAVDTEPATRNKMATQRLQEHLNIVGGQKSQIIVVEYEDPNPALAARIVNNVTHAYSQYGLESRLTMVKEATSWLSARLQNLKSQLENSERQLQAFQDRESMVDSSNRRRILETKMANLASLLVKSQAARAEAEIRYRQVHEMKLAGKGYEELVPLSNNSLVERLFEEFGRLERKLSELGERYGDRHPRMIAAKADRDETERRLVLEINRVAEVIFKDFEAAKAQELEAQRQIDELQQDMQNVAGKGFQQAKLEREVESNRQIYETFMARFKEIDGAGETDQLNVRVIDSAAVPVLPFKPNRGSILFLGLVFGLSLGIGLALLRSNLDNTFKKGADIEEKLLLPVLSELVQLDAAQLGAHMPERFVFHEPRSVFAEAVNHIRTGILFSDLDDPVQTLVVTSSQPSEGKTTLSSNLALSFAHMGRTLLVDADMRRPALRRVLGWEQRPGLSEWIAGSVELEQALRQDDECATLYIMTTGQIPPNPLELLSSNRFRQQIEKLKQEFDYIIFDTPPMLPVSDALVLGNLVDKVILSVRFDVTTYPLAEEMVKRLRSNNIEPLGAVLSMVDMRKLKAYYGNRYYKSNYGEAYGKYYGDEVPA